LRLAPGMQTPADFPNLTEAFLNAGFSDSEVTQIMGGNFLRLFETVWI
jgi:membrane dipeptidase